MRRLKSVIAMALTVAMAAGLFTVSVSAASFSDMAGHWAEATVSRMADAGVVSGVGDSRFEPDRPVTRAEFARLVNNAFGYKTEAAATFSDVSSDAWYASDIRKAVAAGYMRGYDDGTARPTTNIERQQAAVIACSVLDMSGGSAAFTDMSAVADYATSAVRALSSSGIIGGRPDGSFDPKASLTRAEAAVIVERMLNQNGGTSTPASAEVAGSVTVQDKYLADTTVEGNLTVTEAGTTVENVIVRGDLIVASSVGDGDVTLKNVKVDGKTYIRGGGENSVKCIDCSFGQIFIQKDGSVRVVLNGSSSASSVTFTADGKLVISDGATVESVEISAEADKNAKITIEGDVEKITVDAAVTLTVDGKVGEIDLNAATTLKVASGSEVGLLNVTEDAAGSKVDIPKDATVSEAVIDAKMAFTGTGAVEKATINADGVTAVTMPKTVAGDGEITKTTSSGGGAILG